MLVVAIVPRGFYFVFDEVAPDNGRPTGGKHGSFYSDLAFKVQSVSSMILFATVDTISQRKIGVRQVEIKSVRMKSSYDRKT